MTDEFDPTVTAPPEVFVPASPTVTVLAGPTAVGKGTVSTYVRDHYPDVWLSVSATTRAPRPGEVDGVHYFFVSDAEFDRMIEEDDLLEWAVVHNLHRYGTPRHKVQEALAAGRSVLLEIDLQGARSIRQAMPEAQFVFLAPPSLDEMVHRLVGRGTETPERGAVRVRSHGRQRHRGARRRRACGTHGAAG